MNTLLIRKSSRLLAPFPVLNFPVQYLELESHVNEDGLEIVCTEDFSVLKQHVCNVKSKRPIFEQYEPGHADYGSLEVDEEDVTVLEGHTDLVCACAWNPVSNKIASW